jgi:protein-disulfide isomerase
VPLSRRRRYPGPVASRRSVAVQIGLTAAVVVVAVAVVLYVVLSGDKKPASPVSSGSQANSIRVAASNVVTKPGTAEPKVVLSIYEDFLCPFCRAFEQQFGPTVSQLIDSGDVAVDYYMVAILDRPENQHYSSRAGGAAYCVAAQDATPGKEEFRRFHDALYAQQPSETGTEFPTDAQLIETARQAGISDVADCITGGRNTALSAGLAKATDVHSTPTVRINGEDYDPTTPDDLAAKVHELVG